MKTFKKSLVAVVMMTFLFGLDKSYADVKLDKDDLMDMYILTGKLINLHYDTVISKIQYGGSDQYELFHAFELIREYPNLEKCNIDWKEHYKQCKSIVDNVQTNLWIDELIFGKIEEATGSRIPTSDKYYVIKKARKEGLIYNTYSGSCISICNEELGIKGERPGSIFICLNSFITFVTKEEKKEIFDDLFKFTDVSDISEESLKLLKGMYFSGVLDGTSETEMSPRSYVTRGMVAAFTQRFIEPYYENSSTEKFTDIEDTWYTNGVNYCVEKGYISGYTDGTFRPNDYVKLRDLAVMARKMSRERNIPLWTKDEIKQMGIDYSESVKNCPYYAAESLSGLRHDYARFYGKDIRELILDGDELVTREFMVDIIYHTLMRRGYEEKID